MLCFRLVLWGLVLFFLMIPGFFFVGILGRIAGFRPGSPVGTVERVFGVFGIVILGGIMLGICVVGGLIDWGISAAVGFAERNTPRPKVIPANWNENLMARTNLSDMQEFNPQVGFGNFGKRGKLGYRVAYGEDVRVNGKNWPNALSAHPPSFGSSTVSYRLDRTAKLFKAWVALSDTDHPGHRIESPATFRVFGDGACLWMSNTIQHNTVILECRISVEDVETLELQVQCNGTNGNVRAVWLEPHILR